jgi:hypothetical protein
MNGILFEYHFYFFIYYDYHRNVLIYANNWKIIMNKFNTISIKVLFTCLLLSFSVQCCAATTVSIEDLTVEPGGTATVSIMFNDIEDYGTATIELEYNSAIVSVEDVTGSSDSTVIAENIDNTAGRAIISAWNLNGVDGNIVFANVKIKAVGNSGDLSTLTLTVDTLQNISYNEIPATVGSGTFTISGQASTNPTPALNPPTPSPNIETDTSQDEETDINSIPHDTQNDANPSAHSGGEGDDQTQPVASPPSSMIPGFSAFLLCTGLLTAYLITRLNNK